MKIFRSYFAGPLCGFCVLLLAVSAPPPDAHAARAKRNGSQRILSKELFRKKIRAAIRRECRITGKVGVYIRSISARETLFDHRATEKRIPASNIKLLTTAAALRYLGPDYTFPTDVYAHGEIEGGYLFGDLYLKGYGDPSLVQERVRELAYSIHLKGIRRISGDLIGDDSFFDSERYGKKWKVKGSAKAYLAPYSALAVNFSLVRVLAEAGPKPGALARVQLVPPSDAIGLKNTLKTTSRRRRARVLVRRRAGKRKDWIHVSGRIPFRKGTRRYTVAVSDPTRFAAGTFSALLKREGIRIQGKVLTGTTPPEARLLIRQNSRPLGEIIRGLNKHSNNLMAELILKTMGAEMFGLPGTTEKGLLAVQRLLIQAGVPPGSFDLADASGLSRLNKITPKAIVAVLESMFHDFRLFPEYLASLAVVGVDGTIRKRLRRSSAARRVRAKTGLLAGVHALSGYAAADNGETLVFSILSNSQGCRPKRLMNRISLAMVHLDRPLPKGLYRRLFPSRQMLSRPMPIPQKRDRWRRSRRARSGGEGALGGAR